MTALVWLYAFSFVVSLVAVGAWAAAGNVPLAVLAALGASGWAVSGSIKWLEEAS